MAATATCSAQSTKVFNVRDFGARGGDGVEDTAQIQSAIDAATSNGGGVVYFPAGTYIVSPPGSAVVDLYVRQGGVWKLKSSQIAADSSSAGWHFSLLKPANSVGRNGDMALGLRNGEVYRKVSGAWKFDQYLVKKSGTGWFAGHDDPDPSTGSDGNAYLKFHLNVDNRNGAVFQLTPEQNHITFKGDGPEASILSFRTWSGQDPMDYSVDLDSERVLHSAIPVDESGRYKRGSLFVMQQNRINVEFDDIHWEGLQMRGNTTANGKDGWYTPFHDLEEWDISNKGIVFTFGAKPMHNISVKNCSVNGWRGEILYKGGNNYAEILIENCDIFETNASAVSISGNMIMRNSRVWNAYNGVENYCDKGQYSEIYNCQFDLDRKFRGKFGIVYLGTEDAHLIVDGCELKGPLGGVFLSDFANNVTIVDSLFRDCQYGLYMKYMNLYNLPGFFNNIVVRGNDFIAETRKCSFAIYNAVSRNTERNWLVEDNRALSKGERFVVFMRGLHEGPRAEHDVILRNNYAPESYIFDGTGIVPVMEGNVGSIDNINTYKATTDTYPFAATSKDITVSNVNLDGLKMQLDDVARYPEGHTFTIGSGLNNVGRAFEIVPAGWNNLSRGYVIYKGASISFEKRSDGIFHFTGYTASNEDFTTFAPEPTVMTTYGLTEFSLLPEALTVYDSFSGFPVNVPVTLHVNKHVRIAATDYIRTPNGKLLDPDESKPLIALKNANGVLTFPEIDGSSGTGGDPSDYTPESGDLTPAHLWTFDSLVNGRLVRDFGTARRDLDVSQVDSGDGIGSTRGIRFAKGNKGIQLPDCSFINAKVRSTMTVSLWVRVDAVSDQKASAVYEQGGYWRGLNILLVGGRIQANGWNRPQDESDWSGTTLNGPELAPGEWHHIALVLDAGKTVQADGIRLYCDGELADSGPASQLWIQNDNNGLGQVQKTTVFTGRQVRALNPFEGNIDDVSIWTEALSREEIRDLILLSY